MGRHCRGSLAFLLAGLFLMPHVAHGQLQMGASLNPACISMRITYSLCGGILPYPCANLSFWQPKWIVDARASMRDAGKDSSTHYENVVVRPMTVGFEFNDPCAGCTVPTVAALVPYFYNSLSDPLWTAAQAPLMPPHIDAMRVGLWGRLYPRVGVVKHQSPCLASGLAATRGFTIARAPIDLWPVAGAVRPTVPLVPSAYGIVLPCMQLNVPPAPLPCFRAGFDFGLAYHTPSLPGGYYQWIIWKRKTCTVPLPLNWCAEALNGLPKWTLCF